MQQEQKQNVAPQKYWLSLREYNNPSESNAFTKGEFLEPPEKAADEHGINRRNFMKLMGATTLLGSLAGCTRRPVQKLVPYVNKPEEITPGVPNYYSSADPVLGQGLVVTTREGRPIKVDGNPDFPEGGKGIGLRGQASVLDLYDPDRLKSPTVDGKSVGWDEFDREVRGAFNRGQSVHLLTSTVHSPSVKRLVRRFNGKHYQFDAMGMDHIRQGQRDSYGSDVLPRYRFDKAKVVVSIDADFMDTMIHPEEFTRQFMKTRELKGNGYSSLYVFESAMTLTGMNADRRVAIHPADHLHLVLGLANEISSRIGKPNSALSEFTLEAVAKRAGVDEVLLKEVAQQLYRNRGLGLLIAGGVGAKTDFAVAVQNAVNYINSILGNDGAVIDGDEITSNLFQGSMNEVERLITAMNAGSVDTLVIHGFDPIYSLPASAGFADALKKVKNVVYVGQYNDATAREAKFVAAESHAMESWGDVNPSTDLYAVIQPTIRPLWSTRSFQDSLISWAGMAGNSPPEKNSYEMVRNTWRQVRAKYSVSKDFEDFWVEGLHKGFYDGSNNRDANRTKARNYSSGALQRAVAQAGSLRPMRAENSFTLIVKPSMTLGDGSQANNAHLQEIPDPVTKMTWENTVSISPDAAKALSLKDGDYVKVSNASATVELPVLVQPGLRSDVLVTNMGYGRLGGRICDEIGGSAQAFISAVDGSISHVATGVKLAKVPGKFRQLANTQEHHATEGRDVSFETSYEEYLNNPESGIVHHLKELPSLWSEHKYTGYRWGMVIDLNRCSGCASCIMACNVENNVPVVGREEVVRGREMHWIRVDRYYKGDPSNPEVINHPMVCQHCENAPCETVCPVLATVHNDEGLNQMVYNRCVGTRYCANNCPYKVRRFNFFEYNQPMNGKMEYPIPLSKNPEVTIRSRGVMEKCSFCTQRIESAKNIGKREGRRIGDKDLQTACQAACPTDAISFGDVNNPESRVSKERKDPRAFVVLEELGVKPMVSYMTRVWNRTPAKKDNGHH